MGTHGAWDDVPVVNVGGYDDDTDNYHGNLDDFAWPANNNGNNNGTKSKKNGVNSKNDVVKKPVKVRYEGYYIKHGKQQKNGEYLWSAADAQPMPFGQEDIIKMADSHKLAAGRSINDAFIRLGTRRQEVVNELKRQLVANEKDSNADWILYSIKTDTERSGNSIWTTKRPTISKVQVVYKRIDKNPSKATATTKDDNGKAKASGDKLTGKGAAMQDPIVEYLDYDNIQPVQKKGNKKGNGVKAKKNNQQQQQQVFNDPLFDNLDYGQDVFDVPMQQNNQRQHHNQGFGQQHYQDNMHQQIPPHGAIPVGQFQQHPPLNFSARHSTHEIHPFTPHPDVPGPAAIPIESPIMQHGEWPPHIHGQPLHHPDDIHQPQHYRSYSDSRPARRPSHRRSKTESRHQDRKINDLEDQVRDLHLTMAQIAAQPHDDSGESIYSEDSTFSRPLSPTRSWGTPPSSPGTRFSNLHRPPYGGSLERRYSERKRPSYRSRYNRDSMEVIPARSAISNSRFAPRYDDREDRRMSRRRSLQRSQTIDDYPGGSSGRMMRAPDPPSMRPRVEQRRFSEYPSGGGQEYRDREFERRDSVRYDGRRGSVYVDDYNRDGGGRRRRESQYWEN